MNIIEKYSRSTYSSNLRDDDNHHQTEPLLAVALSDKSGIGSFLWRIKYANDASVYKPLLIKWTDIVERKSIKESWGKSIDFRQIARLSINYYIDDICKECNGTGKEKHLSNDQLLSDDDCKICNGTAKNKIPGFKNQIEYVARCIDVLKTKEREIGGRAIAKLARNFDL